MDWQSSAFGNEQGADLFQSFGGDCASVSAPLTNDWLYGYGLGEGPSSGNSSGAEGDGTLDGGLGLAIDWSSFAADLGSSTDTTPLLGSAMSPASLEDLVPSDDSAFLFNPLPVSSMPSATSITTNQPDPYSMSPSTLHYDQAQQSQQLSSGKRRSPPVDHVTALKRQRNNVAARKYRQKRIDRINELELELDEVKQERDDLKLRLARQEAETAALRSMLQMKSGESQKN